MADKQTDKSRYPSKYGTGYVTAAQYISEMICGRIFHKDGKDAMFEFWQSDDWKKTYQVQIIQANRLLKKYSEQAIIQALNTYKGEKIWSLYAKWLVPIIEEQVKILSKIEKEPKQETKVIKRKKEISDTYKSKNLFSKLKE